MDMSSCSILVEYLYSIGILQIGIAYRSSLVLGLIYAQYRDRFEESSSYTHMQDEGGNVLHVAVGARRAGNMEFSTIWRILVDSEMNSHANPQEFTEW